MPSTRRSARTSLSMFVPIAAFFLIAAAAAVLESRARATPSLTAPIAAPAQR